MPSSYVFTYNCAGSVTLHVSVNVNDDDDDDDEYEKMR